MLCETAYDVTVTGEPGFAKAYHIAQQVKAGSTLVTVSVDRARIRPDDTVVFTATVSPALNRGGKVPGGAVVFTLDNARAGVTVQLDANGQARLRLTVPDAQALKVAAVYLPDQERGFLTSRASVNYSVLKR